MSRTHLFCAALLLALVFVAYSPGFDGPLLFDGQAVPEAFEYPPLGTELDAQSTFYIEVFGEVETRLPYTLTVQVGVGVACLPVETGPQRTISPRTYAAKACSGL